MTRVYVLCHDGGPGGYSAPFQAFDKLLDAERAMDILESSSVQGIVLFAIPLFPDTQTTPFYNLKPIRPAP